jgi:hypothetical protein
MTRDDTQRFAEEWAVAWNGRDVEAVLAHFAEDVVFTSPRALEVTGSPTIRGKPALRDYWRRALEAVRSLHFVVERVVWDPVTAELAIVYTSEANGQRKRVSENLTFGPAGLVVRGEVLHGVVPAR